MVRVFNLLQNAIVTFTRSTAIYDRLPDSLAGLKAIIIILAPKLPSR
jgi:hypothetical protein